MLPRRWRSRSPTSSPHPSMRRAARRRRAPPRRSSCAARRTATPVRTVTPSTRSRWRCPRARSSRWPARAARASRRSQGWPPGSCHRPPDPCSRAVSRSRPSRAGTSRAASGSYSNRTPTPGVDGCRRARPRAAQPGTPGDGDRSAGQGRRGVARPHAGARSASVPARDGRAQTGHDRRRARDGHPGPHPRRAHVGARPGEPGRGRSTAADDGSVGERGARDHARPRVRRAGGAPPRRAPRRPRRRVGGDAGGVGGHGRARARRPRSPPLHRLRAALRALADGPAAGSPG